jgi:hypothetical protein
MTRLLSEHLIGNPHVSANAETAIAVHIALKKNLNKYDCR